MRLNRTFSNNFMNFSNKTYTNNKKYMNTINNMNYKNQFYDDIDTMDNYNFINDDFNNLNIKMNNIKMKRNYNFYYKQSKTKNAINVTFILEDGTIIMIESSTSEKVSTLIWKFINKVNNTLGKFGHKWKFLINGNKLNEHLTLAESGIYNDCSIYAFDLANKCIGAGESLSNEINIKFIKLSNNDIYYNNYNQELNSILKLCLLKELSQKISLDKLSNLPELIRVIIKLLKRGYICDDPYNIKKNIREVFEKMKGGNIINFANYINEIIDSNKLYILLNLLNKSDQKEIIDIKNRLSKYVNYVELFNKEFEKSKKESIFEFSVISLVVIEREDFETFEKERKKCPNRIDKILYHGTSVEPISSILTGLYRKSSERRHAINGEGVYFTDLLDYGWYYGGKDNRANCCYAPRIDDTFTVIINSIYYDKNGFKKVNNDNRTPGKNQINFAYSGASTERINFPDKRKFFAGEYVIFDLDQICPFMSATLKRVEFCVIWRDENFSSSPIWNNKFDQIFKQFLKERMKYINQNTKYNIYPCKTSEEALELVKRKKYNKIILISNAGKNLSGKKFVEEARKIIGNDVIALFLAYLPSHLNWVKNMKNALFSNEVNFYEEYLQCFDGDDYDMNYKINNLIKKMEKRYNVKFNFDDNYLYYPYFKNDGTYRDLLFN